MSRSTRIRRIAFTALLLAVVMADMFQIGVIASDTQLDQALLIPGFRIYYGKKVYNPDGSFKACEVPGNNCMIVASIFGDVTICDEGLGFQK